MESFDSITKIEKKLVLPRAIGAQQLTVIYELEKSPHALSDLTVFNPEKKWNLLSFTLRQTD